MHNKGVASFIKKYAKNKLAIVGFAVVLIEIIMVIILPYILKLDPYQTYVFNVKPGTDGHILGTDDVGRDVFARLVYGGRVSLMVGILSTLISVVIGLPLGLIAGYKGGLIGSIIMRFADIFQSFPQMVLILVIVSVTGPSIGIVIAVIGVIGWTGVGRLVYSNVLSVKKKEYVEAAKTCGVSNFGIMFKHVLPNSISPVWMQLTTNISAAILTESALSFMGMGVPSPEASWGNIMNAAQTYINFSMRPWVWLSAGICIIVTVIGINFIGDGVRDAFDPRKR